MYDLDDGASDEGHGGEYKGSRVFGPSVSGGRGEAVIVKWNVTRLDLCRNREWA